MSLWWLPRKLQKRSTTQGLRTEVQRLIRRDNLIRPLADLHTAAGDGAVFYGLLTEEEQEYFRRADEMLDLNAFSDPGERDMLIANVYKEAEGKELKLSNSQGCSRLMERLILLSTPVQLKSLFQNFIGQ